MRADLTHTATARRARWLVSGLCGVLASLTALLTCAGIAQATDVITVTAPNSVTIGANSSTVLQNASVTDSTTPGNTLLVTLATTRGTLSLPTHTNLTLSYGYSSFSGATFSLIGTMSDVNTALQSLTLTGDGTKGQATISIAATVQAPNTAYLASNGHYYQYVANNNITWTAAAAAANADTFDGQEGYLATIPDAAVLQFVDSKLNGATNVWAGGTSMLSTYASYGCTAPLPNGVAREWCWEGQSTPGQPNYGGPLAQSTPFTECTNLSGSCQFINTSPFFEAASASTADVGVNGAGVWNDNAGNGAQEPNNSGGTTQNPNGENYLTINFAGSSGQGTEPDLNYEVGAWNDVQATNSSVSGYVVEYGDQADGASSWSGEGQSSSVSTLGTVPGAPATVTASPGNPGDGTVGVSWTAPTDDGGTTVTGYTVTATPTSGGGLAGSCTTNGTANCTVTGLTPDASYTFSVTATNTFGTGSAATVTATASPEIPDAPTAFTVTQPSRGSTSVDASWSPPDNSVTGAPTGYTVTATSSSDPQSPHSCTVQALSCQLTGLVIGDAYQFSVVASNSSGPGQPATTSGTLLAIVAPGTPTAVTVTPGNPGSGTVAVSWAAPADDGGATISGYTVTATPVGSGQSGSCTTATLSCTVSGLTPGAAYTFSVTATNTSGAGAGGTATATAAPEIPDAPTDFTVTPPARGSTTVHVTWSAPANLGTGTPTGYTVTATSLADPTLHTCTVDPATQPLACEIDGLLSGATYDLSVVASNSSGTGVPATTATTLAPLTAPGTPTDVTLTSSSTQSGGVVVTWSPPADDGGATVTGYTVTATAPGDPTSHGCTAIALSCVVTGLAPGVTYTFSVSAINLVGTGAGVDATATLPVASGPVFPAPAPAATVTGAAMPARQLHAGLTATTASGALTVPLACPAAAGRCTVRGTLVARLRVRDRRHAHTHAARRHLLTIMLARLSGTTFTGGHRAQVRALITRKARRWLRHHHVRRIRVTLRVITTLPGGQTRTRIQHTTLRFRRSRRRGTRRRGTRYSAPARAAAPAALPGSSLTWNR